MGSHPPSFQGAGAPRGLLSLGLTGTDLRGMIWVIRVMMEVMPLQVMPLEGMPLIFHHCFFAVDYASRHVSEPPMWCVRLKMSILTPQQLARPLRCSTLLS